VVLRIDCRIRGVVPTTLDGGSDFLALRSSTRAIRLFKVSFEYGTVTAFNFNPASVRQLGVRPAEVVPGARLGKELHAD